MCVAQPEKKTAMAIIAKMPGRLIRPIIPKSNRRKSLDNRDIFKGFKNMIQSLSRNKRTK